MINRNLNLASLEFFIVLPASPEQFIQLSSDYELLPKFLPGQLKSVRIIQQDSNQTITEEIIVFRTVIKNEICQKTIHYNHQNNELLTEIISGPAKGTTILVVFKKVSDGTEIHVEVKLNLSLKAKILSPIIKKWYKRVLMGIFYKMNNMILNQEKA